MLPDQGVGGRALSVPLVASAPTGTWRVRAFTDPKRPAVGEATFMVEDYVPDRLEFELATTAKGISKARRPRSRSMAIISTARRPPASSSKARWWWRRAAERAGFPQYHFGLADEDVETTRQPLETLPETDANGRARFPVTLDKVPATTRPLEAQIMVRMAEAGGRAIERKLDAAGDPGRGR